MIDTDCEPSLKRQVTDAYASGRPLAIVGGSSKAFVGRAVSHGLDRLSVREHAGVVNYDPSELVITVRAGTRVRELEATLAASGQHLPFEPPCFGPQATVGGTVACGLSGPSRPYAGALRDFVLGTRILNGRGDDLRFGGEVMKNVAGYDVSRLMAGALGTLGVLLEVSLKVLPAPQRHLTLVFECDEGEALARMKRWARRPLPLSGTAHDAGQLFVRLSGSESGVAASAREMGGSELPEGSEFWAALAEQTLAFFDDEAPLWRLSVPPGAPAIDGSLEGRLGRAPRLVEWGGAIRWVKSDRPASEMRDLAATLGGHAGLFRGGDRRGSVAPPLTPGLAKLHGRLKAAFDPKGILNPGRLYEDL